MIRRSMKRAREVEEVPPPPPSPTARDLMDFGNPDPNLHDIVLLVEERKFYCSKAHLARHSPYFYSMFFSSFTEKDKKEIEVNIPNSPDDFQIFLEVIHNLKSVTEENVRDILTLSDLFQTRAASEQCAEFLMRKSRKHRKEKFEIATAFGLNDLKKQIIFDCDDAHDLNKLMPKKMTDLDQTTLSLFAQRNFEIQGFRDNSTGKNVCRRSGKEREGQRLEMRDTEEALKDLGAHGKDVETQRLRTQRQRDRERRRTHRRRVMKERGDSPVVSSSSEDIYD